MLLVVLISLLTTQCAGRMFKSDYLCNIAYYEYEGLRPADFQNEIGRLQRFLQKTPDSPDAAKAHIQLAFLYSHYRNPSPDYYRALEQLTQYASLDPGGSRQASVQNWFRMLQEITAAVSVNEDLKGKAEQMKKEIARLEKENAEMREKLEQLKHLDIELEQKRKLVK